MLRHALPVGVDIDRLTPLLGELHGQLERKPVGGGERECIVARNRVLFRELLEDLEAALERLPEAILLRLDDPLDLLLMLDDLGIPGADLTDDDRGQAVHPIEADPTGLNDRAADEPP